MSDQKISTVRKYVLLFSALNLTSFFIYYTAFYIYRSQASLYVFFYSNELFSIILPLIAAAGIFQVYSSTSLNRSLLVCLYFTLPFLIYLFPYYAYEYANAYIGLEITSVLFFATVHTLFMVAVTYLQIFVLFLLMLFVYGRICAGKGIEDAKGAISGKHMPKLTDPVAVAVFSAAGTMFVYNLVLEIIDTVSYLSDGFGIYDAGDILYIVFRYVFIFAMLFVSYVASLFVKNKFSE